MKNIAFTQTQQAKLLEDFENHLQQRGWSITERVVHTYANFVDDWEFGFWSIQRSKKITPIKLVFIHEMNYLNGWPIETALGECKIEETEITLEFWKMGKQKKKQTWIGALELFLNELDIIEKRRQN